METLDRIKQYNALARSMKTFALFVAGSIGVFVGLSIVYALVGLEESYGNPFAFAIRFVSLLIPLVGLIVGIVYVGRKVSSTKTGEWKEELSHGFPSALKILTELDWEKTLDEISLGRLSYGLYGLVKFAAYWILAFFSLNLIFGASSFFLLHRSVLPSGSLWAVFSFLVVILLLGRDLFRRYKEVHALDMLLLELRWFSLELRRAEFQT